MSDSLAGRAGGALFWNTSIIVGGRGISFARFFVLARILSPDDFGLLAIAWIAIEFLLMMSDLGMIPALVQRREVQERHYDTAWTIGLVRALLVAAAVVTSAPLIASFFAEPRAVDILRVLAVAPLVNSAASAKIAKLTREFRFRSRALIELPEAGTEAVVSIALAPYLGVWALVVGSLTSNVVRLVLSYIVAPHRPRVSFDQGSARSLFRFGRWVFATGVVAVLGEALLRAVISRRLGTAELGLFYLAMRLATMPLYALEAAVEPVVMPLHARLQRELQRVTRVLRATVVGMLALLAPGYAVLFALADPLTTEVLGPQWVGASDPIRVLSAAAVVATFGTACKPMLQGIGRPEVPAWLLGGHTVIAVGSAWWLSGAVGVTGAAIAWLLAETVVAVGWGVATARVVARPLAGMGGQLAGVATATVVAGATAWALDQVLTGLIGFAVTAATAFTGAMALLWLLDRVSGLDLADTLARLFPAVASRLGRDRPR